MLEGLINLWVNSEIVRTEIEVQNFVDAYYVEADSAETSKLKENPTYVVTYDVSARGPLNGDIEEFRRVVRETLTDSRGWIRAGVKFEEVESGGRLHMVLAAPAEVEAAAPGGCSDLLSCTVKPYVLINDDRWLYATDSYNEIGVELANYRRMVINHEVGHFLGHDHIASCETDTGLAPIMLQQSTGLRGCQPNYWPLPSELWVSGL